jgi:DNA polymerase-3 subunit alpha
MIQQVDRILENSARREKNLNQHSLFGADEIVVSSPRLTVLDDYDSQEKLQHEKEALGFYISGHPLQKHKELLETFTLAIESIDSTYDGKEALLGGVVGNIKQVKTRRGDLMAIIELEDLTGMIEITVFPELYKNNLASIFTESELIVKGRLDLREETVNMIASELIPLKDAREQLSQQLRVHIYLPGMENQKIERLKSILEQHQGDCNLTFVLRKPEQFTIDFNPASSFRVRPSRDFIFALEQLLGPECVEWQTSRRYSDIK